MKKLIVFLCGALLMLGCAQGTSSDGISVEQNRNALEGDAGDTGADTEVEEPEFWYLRCNTTSWNLDADSRLQDTDDPNVKSVTFDVTYLWMVTGFDSCAITRTEAEDQWWPGLKFFSASPNPLVVPAVGNTFESYAQFNVKYPALGSYEALLDIEAGTLTINSLSLIPTCDDGILNGEETDIDCGGAICRGCAENKACKIDSDCLSSTCIDDKCVILPSDCDLESAVDLGSDGNNVTVPSNGCVKVADNYPSWWGTDRTMNLMITAGENYPIAFTWENCEDIGDSEEFLNDWQSKLLEHTSSECPTLINLLGSGADDVSLVYYGM